jgi:hypothetical protein
VKPAKGAAKMEAEIEGGAEAAIALALSPPSADGKKRFVASAGKHHEDCGLYAYRPGQEPAELLPFPALDQQFTGEIPANARAPLFVACKTGDVVHASNFLGSLKAPAAAPVPAPAVVNAPAPASAASALRASSPLPKPAAKLSPKTKK